MHAEGDQLPRHTGGRAMRAQQKSDYGYLLKLVLVPLEYHKKVVGDKNKTKTQPNLKTVELGYSLGAFRNAKTGANWYGSQSQNM